MKFKSEKEKLLRALAVAQKATGNAGTLPVLENVFLSAEGQSVEVSATNLEMAITTSFEAKIQNEGKITVPAKTLLSWISLADGDEIAVEKTDGESLFLKTKSAKTKIKGLSADEFPALPMVEKQNAFQISQKDFKKAISKVIFAAAVSGTRPVLSGIFLWSDAENLYFVGTDSYRLSEKKVALAAPPTEKISCIVPAKTLNELERLLSDDGEMEIIFSKNQILFLFDGIRLVSRLIDGQFPNYQQILPKSFKNEIAVDRRAFIQTVKRVGIFARENNNNLKIHFSEKTATITTDATEIGSEESTLEIQNSNGENEIALNAQFLLDALLVISGEKVVFKLGESLAPVLLSTPDDPDFRHLIMPLKN